MPDYTVEELSNRAENANLLRLVAYYRTHGHRGAALDPLDISKPEEVFALNPERLGFNDPQKVYNLAGILHVNASSSKDAREEARIDTIVSHLKRVYCGRVAYEFMHIPNASERRWFSRLLESWNRKVATEDEKKRIWQLLSTSEVFDNFMARKFPNVKRYGLEGAESMLVALDTLFATASKAGIIETVMCMPHRGRLNLLTHLLEMNPTSLFYKLRGNAEFPETIDAMGDVLSHLATSPYLDYGNAKPLHVSLLQNPSHLEAVDPVAMGKARAKQMDLMASEDPDCSLGDRVLCLQLHGDAAFTGQGIVMESLGLSNLPHFTSGGSVHLVVNNQIGYTTPAQNARSSLYPSDIGKMTNCPVIHVNGDFPEDVALASQIAFEYRNKFRKDVIIDLVTYRRMGHNELDEPAYTQPAMYSVIRARKSVPKVYEEQLRSEGIITADQVDQHREARFASLDAALKRVDEYRPEADHLKGQWSGLEYPTSAVTKPETGVEASTLVDVAKASVAYPSGMIVHPRLQKYHIDLRVQRAQEGKRIDWATAEAMAWGSLLLEGNNVRICGQDVGRGTFSQRHAMLVCQETEDVHVPLNAIKPEQNGVLEIANSSLSELAVLGFEYGMSWESPNLLNIWEAQFGDFFSSAQVIFDTYISSSETKWLKQSALTVLLPHGFDGAGPEHSSCRVERFLQLSNDRFDVLNGDETFNPNMHIVNPTTPAQYFHLMRRQMKRNFRKPLIVVAPKTLLRLPAAVSQIEDMIPGTTFQPVLTDLSIQDPNKVSRVIFLSGKLYYDLVKQRHDAGMDDSIAFVRVEELCPFPVHELQGEIQKYSAAKEWVWVQEEPANNGAYTHMRDRLSQILPSGSELHYVGRKEASSPATGISLRHKKEQAGVLSHAVKLHSGTVRL